AAGIILITLGVLFACELIHVLTILDWYYHSPLMMVIRVPSFLFLLGLAVAAGFLITGGIFCLMRKHWRICLASTSFAVFSVVFNIVYFSALSPFSWGWPWEQYIYMRWPIWVMLVPAVISAILVLRTKKEWQVISDSVDSNDASDGD
ncbi:MAG: hypothetical protein OEU97_01615, partial [Dehalococcoidia bacterium]|nr:hypothetical protein [Dehalococcoidia bacterium]